MKTTELIYKGECDQIMGAGLEVYKEKGCGFGEAVRPECLEREFQMRGILFGPKKPPAPAGKGGPLQQTCEPDLICLGKIIVALKAVSARADEPRAQVLNCLNAAGFKLGRLVNFGHYPKREWERIANTAHES